MKLRTLFFCGDRSPYGLSHIGPVLDAFNVDAIVVATEARWNLFKDALAGKKYQTTDREAKPVGVTRRIANSLFRIVPIQGNDKDGRGTGIAESLRGRDIPVWSVFDVNDAAFLEKVRRANPELILSAAYPQIFSNDLISIPSRGSINFHPSLLPKYRGAHPHFWAIVRGENESGLTAHFMTESIDAGDILAQIAFPISQYNYRQLYEKMIAETPGFVKTVARYLQETRPAVQQDPMKATTFRNDRDIHRRVFWNIHTAEEIRNLSRTLSAFCFFRGRKIMIHETFVTNGNRNLTNDVRVEPGTIVDVNGDCLAVKTIDACINIRKLDDGKKIVSFEKWAKKHGIHIGEKFE
jgi:methionyl-tRNA formyltransferase